jgi:hypothetical protein
LRIQQILFGVGSKSTDDVDRDTMFAGLEVQGSGIGA